MSSLSSSKLFKKSPELDAAANHILQIYFKDIAESSKLGKADKIAKWKGAIKAINDELDAVRDLIARTDEIPMTLIGVDTFLKWHEDLGLIDHPWPEWKTALSPSKTDVANHKWLDIVERRYDYHRLGLPMPRVMPTPTPPAQETEMPKSDKGKRKATEAELEQMMAESSHRMEVDDEGEDEVPEKEDEEEEPARGRQKRKAAAKTTSHRSRGRSRSRKATAETDDEDDVPAQGQSKHARSNATGTPGSPASHATVARFDVAMPKAGLPLQLDRIHREPGEKSELEERPQKRHVLMAFKAINAGVGPSNQGETIPEGSSLKIRIPAFKRRDSRPIPAAVRADSIVEAGPSIAQVVEESTVADLERQLRDAEAHRQYYEDRMYDFQIQQDETMQTLDRMARKLEALRIRVYGRPLGDDLIDLFGPLADETRADRTAG
ncbi:hypothetical protein BKA82DRAFT_4019723 [Pisolithus tinctorius]|nr:hypothetical protein BKA82DRAFT_4019723 [Pisolithus tinctorius]